VHQDAVVGIQRHHVGDAAQRDQVEQFTDVRLRLRLVAPRLRKRARRAIST
jgi:hypothetical protein